MTSTATIEKQGQETPKQETQKNTNVIQYLLQEIDVEDVSEEWRAKEVSGDILLLYC